MPRIKEGLTTLLEHQGIIAEVLWFNPPWNGAGISYDRKQRSLNLVRRDLSLLFRETPERGVALEVKNHVTGDAVSARLESFLYSNDGQSIIFFGAVNGQMIRVNRRGNIFKK